MSEDGLHPSHLADGRYEVRRVLGMGGMGIVYEVFDQQLEVRRAIKVVHHHAESKSTERRSRREAQVAAQLAHPHIMTVHDIFEHGSSVYTVMEMGRGSLVDWVAVHGAVPPRLAVETMCLILDALDKAHEQGVIHRDIKPGNLLISKNGLVKLSDFGIAKVMGTGDTGTNTGAVMGSIGFMAPEQRVDSASVGPAADEFGIAGTLFWMITLKAPLDLMLPGQRDSLLDLLPPVLRPILDKATRWDAEDRYGSASLLREAFLEVVSSLPATDVSMADFDPANVPYLIDTIQSSRDSSYERIMDSKPARTTLDSKDPKFSSGGDRMVLLVAMLVSLVVGWSASFLWNSSDEIKIEPAPITQEQVAEAEMKSRPLCEDALVALESRRHYSPSRETIAADLFDIDKDGFSDAIYTNQLDKTLNIYWGNATGTFEYGEHATIPVDRTPTGPAIGDIDKDGLNDLVVANKDKNKVVLIRALGPREFAPPVETFQDGNPTQPVLADWDRDGHLDLLMYLSASRSLVWRPGNDSMEFQAHRTMYLNDLYPDSRQMMAADITGDGFRELFVLPKDTNRLMVFASQKGGSLRAAPQELELISDHADPHEKVSFQFTVRNIQDTPNPEVYVWSGAGPLMRIAPDQEGKWKTCDLAREEVWRDAQQSVRSTLGDFNGDHVVDMAGARTCSFCTSNHHLWFGVKTKDADSVMPLAKE